MVDKREVEEFWGSKDLSWSYCASNRASGGMVILWRENLSNLFCSFKEEGYMGVKALWRGMYINLINIYVSCSYTTRRSLWAALREKKRA